MHRPATAIPGLPDRDLAWRRALLSSAGLPEELSRAVAASHGHDVNSLLGLLHGGCPVATALRITARDDAVRIA